MTIFNDLDQKIREFREKRDKFKEGSWDYCLYSIKVATLQELRMKSLGNYLAAKDDEILKFGEFEPPSYYNFNITRIYGEKY